MNIALKTLRVPATLTAVLATVMLAASVDHPAPVWVDEWPNENEENHA